MKLGTTEDECLEKNFGAWVQHGMGCENISVSISVIRSGWYYHLYQFSVIVRAQTLRGGRIYGFLQVFDPTSSILALGLRLAVDGVT
jgi:hypothetical protein